MKKPTRVAVAVISLLLIVAYFVPMWYIDLEAPQYPEGLGMKIWLNKMTGDLNIINGLNHYIGMKTIHPEAIPELKIMPYLIGVLIAMGFIAAALGKRWFFLLWTMFYIGIGITGLVDFYLWGYDYGHNLDPRAAIKIPDMSYQPPLWGSKQLLNFTAHSYPDIGGTIIMGGALLALLFAFIEVKNIYLWGKIKETKLYAKICELQYKPAAAIFIFSFFFASCSKEPVPIEYGHDACALCKMLITDSRYGSELITKKGKIYMFDSVECLVNYVNSGEVKNENIHTTLITDFASPGNFTNAEKASYLISKNLPSPMGADLTGFSDKIIAEKFQAEHQGEILNWQEVLLKMREHN